MKKPKCIACDLDGTLLLNDAQELNQNTCELIRRLRVEQGIRFIASSGRQYYNLQNLFSPIKEEIGYVCENGCIAFLEGKQIFKAEMSRELGFQLIEDILHTKGAEVLVSGENTSYILKKEKAFYHHIKEVVKNDTTVIESFKEIQEPFFKISIFEVEGLHDVSYWERKYGDICTVATGGEQWLDIMPKGISKESALRPLLKQWEILPEEVMAFGDNDNDLEMLNMVGMPCSLISAKKEIQAKAIYITDTVENAFIKMLNHKGILQ